MKFLKVLGLFCFFFFMFDYIPYYFSGNIDKYDFVLLMILSNTVGFTLVGGILQELGAWHKGWFYKIVITLAFLPICIVGVVIAVLFAMIVYAKFTKVLFVLLIAGVIIVSLIGMGALIESIFNDER